MNCSSKGKATCLPRNKALELMSKEQSKLIFIDSADCAPSEMQQFQCFNPFRFDPQILIPVPGQESFSYSIEAIWQGLKIFDGKIDSDMFHKKPYKRPLEAEQTEYSYSDTVFCYKNYIIDIVTARFLIYLPSYLYLLDRILPQDLCNEIFKYLQCDCDIIFYDWDSNFDIYNKFESFSHSAILTSWFNGTLEKDFLYDLTKIKLEAGINEKMNLDLTRYLNVHQKSRGILNEII
ncbi:DUF6939 family protein [Paenibacillus sp. YYML68]|uniref:DUF6939 family protein n=1 Tax=Paenibacillus sp. YYML68 TaxID=2909250 RepID=UPI002493BA13|nr:hypothetical protein [Paenibacillus sp. YYML68]